MRINKTDVIWNYAATILRVASYALLLPFILRTMPSEMVGVWAVFMAINSFAALLDLGFSPSFTRNVTYIFSGVKNLQVTGFQAEGAGQSVDYGLLKGIIGAMKWFYMRMAIVLFVLLATLGTYYLSSVLKNYKGPQTEIYIAWVVLCAICTYNIYTLYLDCLLQGRGLVRRSKQIVIFGQSVYLVIAAGFIMAKFGLLAIISAQAISVIIIRLLVARSFFTKDIKEALNAAVPRSKKEMLNAIYPNAIRISLTSVGAFIVQRASIIIGSLFLSLEQIASYGVSIQLVSIIANLSILYIATYIPKIVQMRVVGNNEGIKHVYLKGWFVFFTTYLVGSICLLALGEWAMGLIGSKTNLITQGLLLLSLLISFLENNHGMAGTILLTKNEVPFFKASLTGGLLTVLLLLFFFCFTAIGLPAMVIAPGIAQLYNNWKWPYELKKQLGLSKNDISKLLHSVTKH